MEDPEETWPPVPARSDLFDRALAGWLAVVGVVVAVVVLIVTR